MTTINEMFYTLINNAIKETIIDDTLLINSVNGLISLKKDIDIITSNTDKSWAPFKATFCSVLSKLVYPEWDTRKHQTQIGGMYSLRSIDRTYVCSLLHKLGYYDTGTEFALTRSFEKAEPFDFKYSGKISPSNSKTSFLNIVNTINTYYNKELLYSILCYMMDWLKKRKTNIDLLKKKEIVESINSITLKTIQQICDEIFNIGTGASVIPVVVVHTVCELIQPYLWNNIKIKSLKEHTAPDGHTHSYGDIEGDSLEESLLAIEVKHKINIDDSIMLTFNNKTKGIPLRFILTTYKSVNRIEYGDIWIGHVGDFAVNMLQHSLIYKKNICYEFVVKLRKKIIDYTNLSLNIRAKCDEILIKYLV
jgi:hypothetical protein